MRQTAVPDPSARLPLSLYREARAWLLANDPDAEAMRQWSEGLSSTPSSAEHLAYEIIWIILCAGRSAQAARTIERKVLAALREGRPVVEAFGYRAKALAIERAWRERDQDFEAMRRALATGNEVAFIDWCGSIPFVGDDTKFQLAKNLGVDVCKPDIWLCRLTGFADRPRAAVKVRFPACMALCRPLAEGCAERIATVDSLLWLACNKGVLQVSNEAGPVSFSVPRGHRASVIVFT